MSQAQKYRLEIVTFAILILSPQVAFSEPQGIVVRAARPDQRKNRAQSRL